MRHATILIALAVATTAYADGDRTLHLAVHGSVDSAALGAALAKELGVDVMVVDGTCELPCLDVAVDGKNIATIMFAPRAGTPRARNAMLGNDTTQWPLVITLLAGNVVRDEAQDVLAGLPSRDLPGPGAEVISSDVPPAPEEAPALEVAPAVVVPMSPPAPRAPEPVREHTTVGIGFVPVLSTDLTRVGSVRHFLSLDVLVGVSGGSSGLTMSGIADIERGLVAGVQLGGIAAVATRVAGTQLAGIAAAAGDVDGVQVAGIASVADLVDGFQIAGIASVSGSRVSTQVGGITSFARGKAGTQVAGIAAVSGLDAGLQLAGIATFARRGVGAQAAGIAAVSNGDANLQIGGVTAVARGTANFQIAGVVNVAHRVRGLQLAPINVASDVDGVQIGVINYGGSADGFSFGLINIVPGGRYDLETAIDTNKIGTLLFRHGGRRWHNVYGIGGQSTDENADHPIGDSQARANDDVWMYGLGFGPSLSFGNTVVDIEAIGWEVNHGASHERNISILGQLRVSVAHHWGPFAIVAGGVLNTYITDDPASPLMQSERTTSNGTMQTGTTVTTWPSAFFGVRI